MDLEMKHMDREMEGLWKDTDEWMEGYEGCVV